jgi:hypothetical protein
VTFSRADLQQLAGAGISEPDARAQLAFLRGAPPVVVLDRPCTYRDGIDVLEPADFPALEQAAAAAARAGRITVMVPASGAATRMLEPVAAEQRPALWPEIRAALVAGLPKALIPFHREEGRIRTALAEQLLEAAAYATDARGVCRVHATVPPGLADAFRAVAAEIGAEIGLWFELGLSRQEPATDTLAIDERGEPFRLADGSLLLRPGGHGSLLRNLAGLARAGADLVVIKNIDNVLPARRRGEVVAWKRRLVGLLARLHGAGEADHRPLRVCGVVPNQGEPGGGPYWVRGAGEPQIVESAQVDRRAADQAAAWSAATHFNPVDVHCALRPRRGAPHELERFVDPGAVFVTRKTFDGRPLLALEHPGLWNGAMAGWRTRFVEVPAATFAPVKTVADLARPEHQS